MDQDSAFMSSLVNYLFKKLDIKRKTVTPYNHQSLQAEYGIKYLSTTILMKHFTNLGEMWPKYLPLATFAYNILNTPNLANYSSYELVFSRKPKLLLHLEKCLILKFQVHLKIIIIYKINEFSICTNFFRTLDQKDYL